MQWVAALLSELGIEAPGAGRPEPKAFPDGAAFRIEIPSVEGPRVLEAVLKAAEAEGVTVNRVSQGSGAGLLRASELRDMAQAGHDAGVEVCLFTGPRERYGTGAHPRSAEGAAHADQVRGTRQLGYALEDVLRGRAGHPLVPRRRPRAARRAAQGAGARRPAGSDRLEGVRGDGTVQPGDTAAA